MKAVFSAALLAASAALSASAHALPDIAAQACHRHHPELHCSDLEPMCFAEQSRIYRRCIADFRARIRPDPFPHPNLPPAPLTPVSER